MAEARYDGHADWYDATFAGYGAEGGSGGLLARLLGPAAPVGGGEPGSVGDGDTNGGGTGNAICLDVGCGTGRHFAAVAGLGYRIVGADVSADQLRIAASRNPHLVLADAARLPLGDATVAAVIMAFVHTDVDDFPAVVGEAARVLRPGGRLVCLGSHPAFVNAFVDRSGETGGRAPRVLPGYGDERLRRDPMGRYPIRSRVGASYLTIGTFLGAFLGRDSLRLESFTELDTAMRPWRPAGDSGGDGRPLPWNVAVVARAVRRDDAGSPPP